MENGELKVENEEWKGPLIFYTHEGKLGKPHLNRSKNE